MLRWHEHHQFFDFAIRELGQCVVILDMELRRFKCRHGGHGEMQQRMTRLSHHPFLQQLHVFQPFRPCHDYWVFNFFSSSAMRLSSSSSGMSLNKSFPSLPTISFVCRLRQLSGSPLVNAKMIAAVSGAIWR